MKSHAVIACAALMLSACSSAGGPPADLPNGFTPIALAPPPANLCQSAAASDRLRAQASGFDGATVERIALQSLNQCRTLLAVSSDAGLERLASR